MSVTFSKSKGLYKDGIRIQCFFKHDVFTSALSVCRHDNGFITLDYHDDNGVHFIEVTDKDVDFLMSCDDSQTAFDYALSLIPPSENTDNKTVATGEQVGVVDSVGDALSVPVDWSFSDDEAENVFNLLMSAKGFVTCDLMYHNGDYVLLNPRSLPDLTSAIRNDGSCIYYNLNDGNSFVCFDSCENWVGFPNFDSVFTTLNSDDLFLFEELVLDRFLALSDSCQSASNNFPLSNDESLMLSRLKQVIEKYNFDIEI